MGRPPLHRACLACGIVADNGADVRVFRFRLSRSYLATGRSGRTGPHNTTWSVGLCVECLRDAVRGGRLPADSPGVRDSERLRRV